MAASATTEHFDRFENADAAREYVDERDRQKREEREESVELFGVAAELFDGRLQDTFEIERHDTPIEFYRPVDATDTDLSTIKAEDPELADRLAAGSEHLDQFEAAQRDALRQIGRAKQGGGIDGEALEKLHSGALEGTEVMRKALSAFAVDESFRDPRVWKKIFRDEDQISDVFEEFVAEGNEQTRQERRDVLQHILSESASTN